MRFLLNENVSATVIQELRQKGHDVLSVKESMRSEADDVILANAQKEQRILDKDFGEIGFQVPPACLMWCRLISISWLEPGYRQSAHPCGDGQSQRLGGAFLGRYGRPDSHATIARHFVKTGETEKTEKLN